MHGAAVTALYGYHDGGCLGYDSDKHDDHYHNDHDREYASHCEGKHVDASDPERTNILGCTDYHLLFR